MLLGQGGARADQQHHGAHDDQPGKADDIPTKEIKVEQVPGNQLAEGHIAKVEVPTEENIATGIEELQELNTKVEALQGEETGIHATLKDLPKQILAALDARTTAAGIEPNSFGGTSDIEVIDWRDFLNHLVTSPGTLKTVYGLLI